jgi:hypothetical protein
MTTPTTVRAIRLISWVRIAASVIAIGLIIFAAADPRPQGFSRGVREGAGAANPAQLTAREAGAASFRPILAIALSSLLLVFLGRRRLVAARVVEGVGLVASLPSLGTLLSLVVLGLLWAPSVVRYCRGPREAMPAARAPDGP